MIHYSCDRCYRHIDAANELRYIVRVQTQAAFETPNVEIDERDHLSEIQEIIQSLKGTEHAEIGPDLYQEKRYDLCIECYREYISNPLAIEATMEVGFSDN